ncbi:MAG: Short chain enoyl-CoA hydratase [Frankiales bacterium]|nr:Short chain enoyl-CoA hydratase [Frankiales bacterium]
MTGPSSPDPSAPEASVLVARHDHVLLVTLNRPHARNAVDADLARGVADAMDQAEADPDVRCVVLTGAGDRSFCAGADLKALGRGEAPYAPGREHYGFAGFVRRVTGVPVVAAINGTALGGGTELVLACDLAVAADTASFGLPEVHRGLFAAAGGVLRLPEQLPRKVAMRMVLTGQPVDAQEALRWGLVNEVVPAADVVQAALRLAAQVAAVAPLAVQASKRLALGAVDGRIPAEDDAWTRNDAEMRAVRASADVVEGISAFVEKRPPVWQGR